MPAATPDVGEQFQRTTSQAAVCAWGVIEGIAGEGVKNHLRRHSPPSGQSKLRVRDERARRILADYS